MTDNIKPDKDEVATLRFLLRALKRLPSREIYPSAWVSFRVQEKPRDDCRYCIKGLATAVTGGYKDAAASRLTGKDWPEWRNRDEWYWDEPTGLNREVLSELESLSFTVPGTNDASMSAFKSAAVRRKVWRKLVRHIEKRLRKARVA